MEKRHPLPKETDKLTEEFSTETSEAVRDLFRNMYSQSGVPDDKQRTEEEK